MRQGVSRATWLGLLTDVE